MNKLISKNRIKFLLIVLVIILVAQGVFMSKSFPETVSKTFLIEKGEGVLSISKRLDKDKLIESSLLFNLYVAISGNYANLQAGQYSFNQNMNILQIAQKIIKGETAKDLVTIPEGWNLRDIAWFFENKGLFQAEEILEITGFPAIDYSITNNLPTLRDFQEYDFLQAKSQNVSLEGYIFPDTYELEKNFSVEDFIKKTLDNFDEKIDENLKQEIENQNKTIFEIVTMASLIEREAREIEDKKIVSGILWKRLESNMPLQVDATILYFTGRSTTDILKKDLEANSPYNTYQNRGLPLGPICNPGMESILSSINPQDSNYWYYLSTPQGEIIFSKTLNEHNMAKAKYLN